MTVLDQKRAGMAAALIDEANARLAVAASSGRSYLDGPADRTGGSNCPPRGGAPGTYVFDR